MTFNEIRRKRVSQVNSHLLPVCLGGETIRTKPWGSYPKTMGEELAYVQQVLTSEQWFNGSFTRRFEQALANYLEVSHVVAVNTGGMALQIALRSLGLRPGDEVLMQVDTCAADAFAVFNAGLVPVFADSDPSSFSLDWEAAEQTVGARTRAIIPVHIWGRPEEMDKVQEFAQCHHLLVIDDACLAMGAEWRAKRTGTLGDVGVFSFGSLKPFQAGGGAAIVTDDAALARELRVSRSWGEMQEEYGIRDQRELAWNGRIPEVVSAVLCAQLEGYPAHLTLLQENAALLEDMIKDFPGIHLLPKDDTITAQAYTQFRFNIEESELGLTRKVFADALQKEGLPLVWHGAFEPMTTLSFFRENHWRTWAAAYPDPDRLLDNYSRSYPGSTYGFDHVGISIGRNILLSGFEGLRDSAQIIERVCTNAVRIAENLAIQER
jgi:dTDP-4-amino-4,6-dideoxygalactose transaminase